MRKGRCRRRGAPCRNPRLETLAGATITGKYKLLEEIGAGGMGVVWMAEQRVPVRRLVAVKLIKAGMDSRSVVARFEAERQALAMMDHPNIARVFDGGMTEEGRPYFAMEFVRGLPVTQYCDQRRMTVRDRLLLFTEICQAVQHAHQKGIIHRDIKPSNVLVTEHDGKPVPKVIDFGLAKALGGAGVLTEHTLHTAFGAMAGTPLYTAPEQVAINALDIDTRADIYALGVLLYELLTGSPPLERERLEKAAWDEVCRVIREEEPPRPSMRISASLLLPSLAASRQSEPGKLSGLIRGDLDWIVLKALEKERNRRYDTATALVADIERHLNDEPVVAAPPTFGYRARKFVRKHCGPVIAGAAAAALLALGLATTTWQWRRADENASVAQRNEQIAAAELIEVERHRQEAQKQRDTAVEANRRAAEQAARLATFVAVRCAEEGIHAVKGEDPSLALLYFARAIRLAPDPASAEMNRRRFNIALHRLPRPADVIPPDVAHTIYHGLALRFRWGSKLELIDARTTVAIPNVKFELAGMTVQYAEFSPDGRYVIADCYDGKGNSQARLYETATGRLACPPMPHTINCDITFTPDGRYVTTTPDGDRMVLKSVPDGHDGPDKMPWGRLCFNPNGHLVIINCGESARVWDVNTSKPVTEPFCPPPDCCAGAFSCDGTRVAANMGQDVRVLDTASGRPISPPIRADCTALEFSPDGRTILTGGKMWHVWNATTGEQELSLVQPGFPRRAAFSPDGKRLATANEDPDNVVVRDAGTGSPLCGPIHRSAQGLGFSADGRQLVTIPSVNEGIGVWDLSAFDQTMPAREPLLDDKSLPAFNNSLIFSQDGKLATRIRFSEDTRVSSFKPVTRAGFSVIQLWNSQTCARLSPPIRLDHTPFDKKPMFVENGARLFADNVLIDTVTGAPQGRNLSLSSTAAPFLLTISSDGQRVLTAAGNELQVLDSQTRRRTAHFPLPWAKTADAVTARFSPNGRHLVVNWGFRSSESNNACLIDLDNGQSTTLETSQSETDCKEELIEFNPDGQWFLLGYGGHLRAYRVSDGTRMPLPSGLLYAASGDTTHLVIESRDRGPALQTWKIHSASEGPRQVSTFSHCAPIAAGALGQFVTSSASFCSNRGLSAALSSDGRLYWENGSLIDTQTGAHVADQLDPTNGASFIMAGFSSDSRSVAMFLSQSPIVFDISPIAAPVEHLELLAEFLSERRMTSDGLVIPDEESEETRSKFFATCHDIFPPPTASAEAGQTVVVPAYRDAVAARVAAATDEPSRKDLAEQFAAGADIEVRAAAYEHAALLGESALKLDPDNLWAGDRLAIAYLWVGRYDDALGLYHRCKGRTFLVDAELRVFGQNVPDHVAALRKAKMDNPALAKIESLIAPTRQLKGKDLLNSAMLVILKPELSATRYATALESLAAVARSSPTDPDLLRILARASTGSTVSTRPSKT